MTTPKHTPGDWYVERPYGELGLYVSAAPNGELICRVCDDPTDDGPKRAIANAGLMAAAPKMFNMLCHLAIRPDLLTDPRYRQQVQDLVRKVDPEGVRLSKTPSAAIAQATGGDK
jgi:hypothetical protein